ncbi:unnamed protein product [Symbiodinium necroappetens]|uniref:Pherophorin domain-containing protein n=1 Tax=Symbiodinium necroappetens TaxID=1628268 RepID=A0A812X0T0_9DINO|nr:unnamed protein product [Symbiodinium necroappetens]
MQMCSWATVVVVTLLGRVCAKEAAAACSTASIDGCSSAKPDETALLQLDSGDLSKASKEGLNRPRRRWHRRGSGKNGAYSYTYGKYGYKTTAKTTSTTTTTTTTVLCNYVISISRSDQGASTHWQSRTATGPPGTTFETGRDFDEFCSTTYNENAFGADFCMQNFSVPAGVRLIKSSTGDIVGSGVCCNWVTNHILQVSSDCGPTVVEPPVCTYTVEVERSDQPGTGNFNLKVAGPPGDSFTFDGTCSADPEVPLASLCLGFNVAAGVRILKNSANESVQSGTCCNTVQNSVVSVTDDCSD